MNTDERVLQVHTRVLNAITFDLPPSYFILMGELSKIKAEREVLECANQNGLVRGDTL